MWESFLLNTFGSMNVNAFAFSAFVSSLLAARKLSVFHQLHPSQQTDVFDAFFLLGVNLAEILSFTLLFVHLQDR